MPKPSKSAVDPAKTPIRRVADRALIRELFAERKREYDLADVLRLTRSGEEEIAAAIWCGVLDVARVSDAVWLWEDVAELALRRWTPRMVAAALGVGCMDALPPLNRVKQIAVHLPLYQIRLLHVLAEARGAGFRMRLNASDILEQQLVDLASSVDVNQMEMAIPGFAAALQYPSSIPCDDYWKTTFCRFCGRVSRVAGPEMCDDCKRRHEPEMHLGEDGMPELDREES
jgi:hypothetical protein